MLYSPPENNFCFSVKIIPKSTRLPTTCGHCWSLLLLCVYRECVQMSRCYGNCVYGHKSIIECVIFTIHTHTCSYLRNNVHNYVSVLCHDCQTVCLEVSISNVIPESLNICPQLHLKQISQSSGNYITYTHTSRQAGYCITSLSLSLSLHYFIIIYSIIVYNNRAYTEVCECLYMCNCV